jgi:hypothetical protein
LAFGLATSYVTFKSSEEEENKRNKNSQDSQKKKTKAIPKVFLLETFVFGK